MARRGENIYKRKDNRWEGRYIKGYDCTGKAKYGYVYSYSYREVRAKLQAAKAGVLEGTERKPKNLGCFCDEWLVLTRSRVKESTYVKYHNTIHRHIKPALGAYRPQSLNTILIEEFSRKLLSDGLSPKTVRDILTVLRSILNYYYRCENVTPSAQLEIIYPRESRPEMRVLSITEQKTLIRFLLSGSTDHDAEQPDSDVCLDCVRFGILLALLTGMRIGEICALRWENISLQEGLIRVTSTMQRLQVLDCPDAPRTAVKIGSAKSSASVRIIPLSKNAAELCRIMQPESGTGFILTGQEETYMEPRVLQYWFQKYTRACGLEGVHFHTLRHTFATRCVEMDFEIKSLSEILGHSSIRVTLDRYVHTSLDLKRANMDKLAAIGM